MRGTQTAVSSCPPSISPSSAWWSALIGYSTVSYGVQTYIQVLFVPIYVPVVVVRVGPASGPAAARRHCARGHARAMFTSLTMRASAFTTSSLTMASSSKYSKGATRRRACATPRARLDAGVGAFGSKAGMTQVFTEDGLCVPVTVIAVREGNVVTQVRIRGIFFVCVRARARSRRCRSTRRRIHSFIHSRARRVGDATRRRWARRRP